jgi:phage shock protein PspC (stress-responsive transcriptional regulator)
MTTTDLGAVPPAAAPSRVLRRTRTGRVGAGVASGLGDYFGLDPVLFRVLFATSAFFGGAGVIAYLLAWAAIPEEGTAHAPLDRWMATMRRRRLPLWLVAVSAAVLLWAVAFSWWAPGPFVPVVVVVTLLIVFLGRRDPNAGTSAPDVTAGPVPTVDLTKPVAASPEPEQPTWVNDARSWLDESRAAARTRRRRAQPVRLATLGLLVVALAVLGIADAVSGIQLQAYAWTALGIVGAGLLVGAALRRFSAGLIPLFVLTAVASVAFAGSHASLHDGMGQREWRPTGTPASSYRLAFGQGVLDLRALPPQSGGRTIRVTLGAGQVQVIAPKSMNLTVQANVHIGQLEVDRAVFDGRRFGDGDDHHGGVGISRIVAPPAGATGQPVLVDVHLTDGNLDVEHR